MVEFMTPEPIIIYLLYHKFINPHISLYFNIYIYTSLKKNHYFYDG